MSPASARQWWAVVDRNLQMADLLLSEHFGDGAAFHYLHATEAAVTALYTQLRPDLELRAEPYHAHHLHRKKFEIARDMFKREGYAALANEVAGVEDYIAKREDTLYVTRRGQLPQATFKDEVYVGKMAEKLKALIQHLRDPKPG